MTIEKNLAGTSLEVAIIGRIDTTTSPELEKALSESTEGIDELVLDFAQVEYISSAGLRVLLVAQKVMSKQGEMRLKNVSQDIMEIFEVTGFSGILTIE